MPQQRSRTRAVIPGKAILGKAGAEKAERSTMGGAVVPGRKILGDLAAQEQARAAEARKPKAPVDPKAATGPAAKAKPAADTGLPPLVPPGRKSTKTPAPPPSLSEGQVVVMLEADPESWEHVLDLESERPDGVRPAVAAAIVRVAPRLVENPVPDDALAALKVLVGDAQESGDAPDAPPAPAA